MNTVLTILLTIVVLTALYAQIWHKGLNNVVIRQETDTIVCTNSENVHSSNCLESSEIPRCRLLSTTGCFTSQHLHRRIEFWSEIRSCRSVQQFNYYGSRQNSFLRLWR
jgi:hypothetical protein